MTRKAVLLVPWSEGGIVPVMEKLAHALTLRGVEVHWISPESVHVKHKKVISHLSRIIGRPGKRFSKFFSTYVPYYLQMLSRIFRFGRGEEVVLVVSPHLEIPFILLWRMLKRSRKLVLYVHSDITTEHLLRERENLPTPISNLYIKIFDALHRLAQARADSSIFVSEYLMNATEEKLHFVNANSTVVHHAIDPSWEALTAGQNNPFDSEDRTAISYVGRLSKEKGVEYLVNAFKLVKSDCPNATLWLVGDGPEREKLAKLVRKLNLENGIFFAGRRDNPFAFMRDSYLMVLPSLTESFGMVILESLSCNTPIIGSRAGGIVEVLEYEELLFAPKSTEELASKIRELILDKTVYQRAKELCEKRRREFEFDWNSLVTENILNLFNEHDVESLASGEDKTLYRQ